MRNIPTVNFAPDFSPSIFRDRGGKPQVPVAVGPPVITFGTTLEYALLYNDKGSGADRDGAFWRPTPPDGFFFFGDYLQGDYGDPTLPSITVKVENDDTDNPVIKSPTGFAQVWLDTGSGADMDGSIWMPVPPPGYVALGAVANTGHSAPNPNKLVCMRFDLVQTGTIGALIWSDRGSHADSDVANYAITGLSTFYAQANYNEPLGPVWIPKALV